MSKLFYFRDMVLAPPFSCAFSTKGFSVTSFFSLGLILLFHPLSALRIFSLFPHITGWKHAQAHLLLILTYLHNLHIYTYIYTTSDFHNIFLSTRYVSVQHLLIPVWPAPGPLTWLHIHHGDVSGCIKSVQYAGHFITSSPYRWPESLPQYS